MKISNLGTNSAQLTTPQGTITLPPSFTIDLPAVTVNAIDYEDGYGPAQTIILQDGSATIIPLPRQHDYLLEGVGYGAPLFAVFIALYFVRRGLAVSTDLTR